MGLGAVESRFSPFGLLGALARFEMGDKCFFTLESCLLLLVGAELDHASFDALLAECGVVAWVLDQSRMLDFNDAMDNLVEHVAVVADEDDRSIELVSEEAFEPFSTLDIEVVGGLVKEEDRGVLEEELSQRDTGELAAG